MEEDEGNYSTMTLRTLLTYDNIYFCWKYFSALFCFVYSVSTKHSIKSDSEYHFGTWIDVLFDKSN